MRYMIDVYSGNGPINWQAVAKSGFRLAYLKCSQGATERDPRFQENTRGCNVNGVKWGAYHFVTGVGGDAQWANGGAFLASSQLLPCLDIEQIDGVPDALIWTRAYTLLMHLLETGRIPLIYTDRDMCKALLKLPGLAKEFALCPLWLADYETEASQLEQTVSVPAPWAHYMFRQYTEKAEIAGATNIDVSVAGDVGIRWLELTSK